MTPHAEKRALQAAMVVVLLVPLGGAAMGIAQGPAWLDRGAAGVDLDSHFRYLSGLLLAMSALFLSCVPGIERKGARMRLIAVLPVVGGLARLLSLLVAGVPGTAHLAALGIEIGVVPMLVLWQARVARRLS
ncbi:DUF4345 domain-containing protein [Sphingomonas sp. CJ20]